MIAQLEPNRPLPRAWARVAIGTAVVLTVLAPGHFAMVAHAAEPRAELVAPVAGAAPNAVSDAAAFDQFLNRLMMAESGGRADAKNPRSTALGPFQFLDSTFLDVVRRHFAAETAGLSPAQILALRTEPVFARRAAAAFTQDNADYLTGLGLTASFANLRLAHLLGPAGAAQVLRAPMTSQVALWLGPAVLAANPFMAGMRVEELIARCQREVTSQGGLAGRPGGPKAAAAKPRVEVACDLSLASCRRWRALAERRIVVRARR
jgi:hypothetical protein